ncbi:MAG: TetR/AcrR family transcriptional regulator [Rikenellaceae bacterium]
MSEILSKESISTRDLIVEQANEIVNQIGMMDFRIDTLAKALKISPGNITYHFARKDDILSAIWFRFNKEVVTNIDSYITPFFDVKQLFLLFRYLLNTIYSYRGVVSCILGDSGIAKRDEEFNKSMWLALNHKYTSLETLLVDGGYMVAIDDKMIDKLCFESQVSSIAWWVNHALSSNEGEILSLVDYYSMIAILPLRPFLTDKGNEQLIEVMSLVSNDTK